MMRVGYGTTVLNKGLWLGGIDGIGSYTRELFKAISLRSAPELIPISFGINHAGIDARHPGVVMGRFDVSAMASAMTGAPFYGVGRLASQINIFHSTDHLIPNLGKLPVVATVMDAIPLSHPDLVKRIHLRSIKYALWRRTVKWAAHIITISNFSKVEIIKHFGLPADSISVIPLGVDTRWFHDISLEQMSGVVTRLDLPKKYFLSIGTLQPRKNVRRVIEAYQSLPYKVRNMVPLLIVGRHGWKCEDIVDALERQAYGSTVRWLKYLSDNDLLIVMKRATALVFPSLLEGFGLPVLEAFAAGTPVITSNISSLPEVAGDAAIMVDPFDTQAISEAMLDIINDEELANTLKKKGTQRAKEYTWDRTAAMTIEVYRQVLVV